MFEEGVSRVHDTLYLWRERTPEIDSLFKADSLALMSIATKIDARNFLPSTKSLGDITSLADPTTWRIWTLPFGGSSVGRPVYLDSIRSEMETLDGLRVIHIDSIQDSTLPDFIWSSNINAITSYHGNLSSLGSVDEARLLGMYIVLVDHKFTTIPDVLLNATPKAGERINVKLWENPVSASASETWEQRKQLAINKNVWITLTLEEYYELVEMIL